MRYADEDLLDFVEAHYDIESFLEFIQKDETDFFNYFKEDVLEINRDKFEQALREFRVSNGYDEPEEIDNINSAVFKDLYD